MWLKTPSGFVTKDKPNADETRALDINGEKIVGSFKEGTKNRGYFLEPEPAAPAGRDDREPRD